MKKNIFIVALAVLCLVSLGYGHYQRVRADKLEADLTMEKERARTAERMAVMERKAAEAAVQEAYEQKSRPAAALAKNK